MKEVGPPQIVEKKVPQQPPAKSRAEFLASVHEQRLHSQANAYGGLSKTAPKRAPEVYQQMNDYRKQHKSHHVPQPRVMTLADLDRQQSAPPLYTGPQPSNHSISDFSSARDIALRAFHLVWVDADE